MIDFRYHLVSLVSVFMALAIGVVLGAGPLQGSIGDQLSSQAADLVRDKADLQQAVENRDAQIADRDSFVAAVGPQLTAGRLDGRRVAVLTLPGADSGAVDALAEQVEQAGGVVTGRVSLSPRWSDPDQAAARESIAARLLSLLGPAQAPDPSGGVEADLAAVLAAGLLGPGQPLLDGLADGDLVGVDGEPQTGADLAVVVGGAPQDSAGFDDPQWSRAAASSDLAVLSALDRSGGVVLAGPVAAAQDDGVVGRLRRDALAGAVSGVDSADTAMGRVTTVLALAEQAVGRSGQYGAGDNAAAPVPDVGEGTGNGDAAGGADG